MKRGLDLSLALFALILSAPLLMAVAVFIRIFMGRPILFRQTRIGLNEAPFQIAKFRTMAEIHDARGELLPDRMRLTRLGHFIRGASIDELPQLLNVLRGDMSLVGPRPLLPEYLPRYNAQQRRRHEVRPGITGWAQVNGRNNLTWERKFDLDVWYVDHRSLRLDAKILWLTLLKVVGRDGISPAGHATMPEFRGPH